MNPKDYSQMMSYLTRPSMAQGGRIEFSNGGEALKQKNLQKDYAKYGKDKLEEATKILLSDDFGRAATATTNFAIEDAKRLGLNTYEDLTPDLKAKIRNQINKYGRLIPESEARLLGRKSKTETDRLKSNLPDQGAKIVKEGDKIVDINFADPEIKKQFLEDFDRRYEGSRMTAKKRGVDNASLYKKYLSNLTPKTAELALAGLANKKNKSYVTRPYGFYDRQTNIKRTERVDKATKKAGKGVAEINKEQKK